MTLCITVAVPTLNRPDDLARCLGSLARVRYDAWELVIVDQGDAATTARLVAARQRRLPPCRHLRQEGKGLSRARNLALHEARGEVVAFLDDDCTVGECWLTDLAALLDRCPAAGVAFGRVTAAPHDVSRSFIPVAESPREIVIRRRLDARLLWSTRPFAIGASMCLRRWAWERLGPFDVVLGAGACHPSGEETDYLQRALWRGIPVVLSPTVAVQHHGERPLDEAAVGAMIRDANLAVGAVHMKLLRCGDLSTVVVIAAKIAGLVRRVDVARLLRKRRASGVSWLVSYLRGLRESFRHPVDRRLGVYRG